MTFFEGYTYRQKNNVLVLLVILLAAVAYKHSYLTTSELIEERDRLDFEKEKARYADESIQIKQKELFLLNNFIGKQNLSVEEVQQDFLNFFDSCATNLIVYEIDKVRTYAHPDFQINTHKIVIKGDFIESLKFVHKLESDFRSGVVYNADFEIQKRAIDAKRVLFTTLLIQNYVK